MKFAYLLVSFCILSSCVKDTTSVYENVASEESSAKINTEITPGTKQRVLQESSKYVAKNADELSDLDVETAYEMCVRALTDYYKAVWNGSDIELDTFIDNDSLKQYTQKRFNPNLICIQHILILMMRYKILKLALGK